MKQVFGYNEFGYNELCNIIFYIKTALQKKEQTKNLQQGFGRLNAKGLLFFSIDTINYSAILKKSK